MGLYRHSEVALMPKLLEYDNSLVGEAEHFHTGYIWKAILDWQVRV